MLIGISENLAGCRTRQNQPPAIGTGHEHAEHAEHAESCFLGAWAAPTIDFRPIEEDT
jgi:hypothetical protein